MIDVSCGIIIREGLVLATQRKADQSHPGLWEFPGGKTEPGESHADGLRREIEEELAMEIELLRPLDSLVHVYAEKNITIRLWPFICGWLAGEPQLRVHQALRWVPPTDLGDLNWSAADRRLLPSLGELPRP